MPNVTISLYAFCDKCGASLEAYADFDRNGDLRVSVVPCKVCLDAALDAALAAAEEEK